MKVTAQPRSVIGRMAMIEHKRQRYVVNIIDAVANENRAKRVRVQTRGSLQGQVLMPGEYALLEYLD